MTNLVKDRKNVWQKPENWFTWAGITVLGYGALRALDAALPLLTRVLENVLYTSLLAGGTALVGWLLVNKDVHRLAWYAYKSAMRWVTRRFVEIDPIAIMRTFIVQLEGNLAEISEAIGALRGQTRKLEAKIRATTEKQEQSMNMAAQAKARGDQRGMRAEMALQMRKAGRAEKSNITYQGLLNRMKAHLAVMEKVEEASNLMVADIKDTVEEETEKRSMIQASHKAMSASHRILAEGERRELYDLAMEQVTTDYYSKLGEIEQFMDDSTHFINTMDLENGVYEADALFRLQEWEKRSASLLEGGSGKTKYRVPPLLARSDLEDHPEPEKTATAFAKLFDDIE
jgi:hypothetical protein